MWLEILLLLLLLNLSNRADLSHQAILILHTTLLLGDLAFLYALDGDARKLHLFGAGRSSAHILPLVGG